MVVPYVFFIVGTARNLRDRRPVYKNVLYDEAEELLQEAVESRNWLDSQRQNGGLAVLLNDLSHRRQMRVKRSTWLDLKLGLKNLRTGADIKTHPKEKRRTFSFPRDDFESKGTKKQKNELLSSGMKALDRPLRDSRIRNVKDTKVVELAQKRSCVLCFLKKLKTFKFSPQMSSQMGEGTKGHAGAHAVSAPRLVIGSKEGPPLSSQSVKQISPPYIRIGRSVLQVDQVSRRQRKPKRLK